MTNKAILKRLNLTEAELAELVRAARDTWQGIAYDVLQAVSEGGGKKMPRSHVIEVVLDADHIVMMQGSKLSPAVKAALSHSGPSHDYEALKAALKPHFSEEWV